MWICWKWKKIQLFKLLFKLALSRGSFEQKCHSMCRRDGLFGKIKDHFEWKPHVSIGIP